MAQLSSSSALAISEQTQTQQLQATWQHNLLTSSWHTCKHRDTEAFMPAALSLLAGTTAGRTASRSRRSQATLQTCPAAQHPPLVLLLPLIPIVRHEQHQWRSTLFLLLVAGMPLFWAWRSRGWGVKWPLDLGGPGVSLQAAPLADAEKCSWPLISFSVICGNCLH
jgi:hypothetical protein